MEHKISGLRINYALSILLYAFFGYTIATLISELIRFNARDGQRNGWLIEYSIAFTLLLLCYVFRVVNLFRSQTLKIDKGRGIIRVSTYCVFGSKQTREIRISDIKVCYIYEHLSLVTVDFKIAIKLKDDNVDNSIKVS